MDPAVVAPTREDPVVAGLSASVGGPLGPRAGRHPWWTPLRVLLALAAVALVLGMVQKAPCVASSYQDGQARYDLMCYSDLPYLYTGRGLSELAWPWSGDPAVRERFEVLEYPVGIGYAAWGTAAVVHLVTGRPDLVARAALPTEGMFSRPDVAVEVVAYLAVNAVVLGGAALLTVALLSRVHRRRPWDAAGFAVAPALVMTGLVNWDLLAVACTAWALLAWSRGRPGWTGVALGVGTAVKLYPALLLGAVLVLCLRDRGRGRGARTFALTTVAGVASWAVVNLPAHVSGPEQWRVFWSFNADRGADLGSLWLVLEQALGEGADLPLGLVNNASYAVLALWCLGVLVVGLRAPEPPRLAQLGLLVLIGFLVVNKVYSPQYVLWLLPLAALAVPRWRVLLAWQAAELVYVAAVWWYLGGHLEPAGGGPAVVYWLAILLRVCAQVALAGVVVRDLLEPEHDPVREERVLLS